jgi:hypothetical protein
VPKPAVSHLTRSFGKFIVEYNEKWAKVIRAANIKPE